VKDSMVDGLFFCATITGRRGGHTSFVQAGAETPDIGEAEAVKSDPGSSYSGLGGRRCRGWKCGVLWDCPSTPHSIGDPPTALHVCCCRQMNWWDVVRRDYYWRQARTQKGGPYRKTNVLRLVFVLSCTAAFLNVMVLNVKNVGKHCWW